MVEKVFVPLTQLVSYTRLLAENIRSYEQLNDFTFQLVAIERGGVPIAEMIASHLKRSFDRVKISFYEGEKKKDTPIVDFHETQFAPNKPVLMIDDLVDTGATIEFFKLKLQEQGVRSKVAVVYKKPTSTVAPDFWIMQTDHWIVFPWEINDE